MSCNGDFINDLTYNDNKELKSKVFDKVKTVYPSLSDSDIETVVPLNKNIKRIKIFCRCPDIKKSILIEAKNRKLKDIYFSEFLTARRFKLFYELRQLKKEFANKIFAVYTRNGNLFCKLSADENQIPIKMQKDIQHLRTQLSGSDNE